MGLPNVVEGSIEVGIHRYAAVDSMGCHLYNSSSQIKQERVHIM